MKKYFIIIFLSCLQLLAFAQLNTDRILTIGRNALYFDDYVLSIQYFNQVIRIKPHLAEPYMYRAMAKIQLGDYAGAELDATLAIERNPFMPQAHYVRGFANRQLNSNEQAAIDFSKALEFSPSNINILMNRMDALVRIEKYDDALKDLDTYISRQPNNNGLHYERGVIYLMKKDTVAAESAFRKVIETEKTNANAWSALALLKMQNKNLDSAYVYYSNAIKNKSNYNGDYINRGIINVQQKRFREALSDYDKAIALDANSDLAFYNRGLLRSSLGDNNNALSDFDKVLKLNPDNNEALLSRAMMHNTLRMYKNAIADYKKIIEKFPYFSPAFLGIADAEDALGNKRTAFRYRQQAYDIEQNKDKIKDKQGAKEDLLANENKMSTSAPKSNNSRRTEMFNRFVNQNTDDTQADSKYADARRGNVQNRNTEVVNERMFVLSYYAKYDETRRTNLYHPQVNTYNRNKSLASSLKVTNNELALTDELVNYHFTNIDKISKQLEELSDRPDLFFIRAMEYALVQDFSSAINDLNRTLALQPDNVLAYFMRANMRYKLIDYVRNNDDESSFQNIEGTAERTRKLSTDNQYKFEVELILRDYEKTVELSSDFAFAYYNKANFLCAQLDFKTGIAQYSKAIEADADFAEAYFNRGLTYIFIGEEEKGLADLSKAGELGIYRAYNLIQRFGK